MKLLTNVDFSQNEGQNLVIQRLSSAPSSPVTGQIYYNTTLARLGVWNGTAWQYFLLPSSTDTLTNKSIDAASNAISNLLLSMFASGVIDTDGTLSANSDSRLATQKAIVTYVTGLVTGSLIYSGSIDASANPNYPAATKGYFYKISAAGKLGGASGVDVQVGDAIICNTTTVSGNQAAVGSNWDCIQSNVDQATTAVLGLVKLATSSEAEAKSDISKAITASCLTNFPVKKIFTIGDGASTSITVTHSLGSKDVIVQVRDAGTDSVVVCDITTNNVNTCTLSFTTAPASNAYKVVIIG